MPGQLLGQMPLLRLRSAPCLRSAPWLRPALWLRSALWLRQGQEVRGEPVRRPAHRPS